MSFVLSPMDILYRLLVVVKWLGLLGITAFALNVCLIAGGTPEWAWPSTWSEHAVHGIRAAAQTLGEFWGWGYGKVAYALSHILEKLGPAFHTTADAAWQLITVPFVATWDFFVSLFRAVRHAEPTRYVSPWVIFLGSVLLPVAILMAVVTRCLQQSGSSLPDMALDVLRVAVFGRDSVVAADGIASASVPASSARLPTRSTRATTSRE